MLYDYVTYVGKIFVSFSSFLCATLDPFHSKSIVLYLRLTFLATAEAADESEKKIIEKEQNQEIEGILSMFFILILQIESGHLHVNKPLHQENKYLVFKQYRAPVAEKF